MLNIGLFGIGLDTYWSQFEGLLQRLEGYQETVYQKLNATGAKLINAGIIDNPHKANETALLFQQKNADVVFLFITTYALSHLLPLMLYRTMYYP